MRRFVPDEVLPSVLDIDLSSLKRRKIKGLLIDLDNTLVGWGESHMEPGFAAWIKQAREAGFEVSLVSNAMPDRVDAFASELDIPQVSKAMKPLRRAFCRALRVLGLETHEAAVIGDQLFTDVYGGNRLGLYTILINPLSTRGAEDNALGAPLGEAAVQDYDQARFSEPRCYDNSREKGA